MEFSNNFLGGYFSEVINIKRFKEENSCTNQSVKNSKINNRTILTKLSSINENIDLSNLVSEMTHCESELQKHNFQEVFDSPDTLSARCLPPIYGSIDSDLKTLRKVKNDLYQTKRTKLYTPHPTFTPRGNIVPGQTLLIKVSLYYPFHWTKDQIPDEAVIPHCKNVIQFYDGQTLKDLKQGFKCENIHSEISGDISENPLKPLEFLAHSDLKPGLFYINNNIYVDSLQSESMSLTHANTIQQWLKSHDRSIGNILSMDTQLLDLEVRIGEPYVYQHLGRCEHLFIFNEISFAQSYDCLGQTNYPRIISVEKEKLKNCIFCNKSIASIVMISNDERTPLTVNHICENCFNSYNYDHLGDKISDFKAYRAVKWRK